jgi:hypothetical protein
MIIKLMLKAGLSSIHLVVEQLAGELECIKD